MHGPSQSYDTINTESHEEVSACSSRLSGCFSFLEAVEHGHYSFGTFSIIGGV